MSRISHARQPSALAQGLLYEALAQNYARLRAAWTAFASERAKRRRVRETVDALMALNERQLRDIGLSRTEVLSAVYSAGEERTLDIRLPD